MVCSYHQFSHGYKYVSLPPGQLHFPAIRPQVLMCTILLLLWSSNVETLLEATHTHIYIYINMYVNKDIYKCVQV